MRSPSAGSEVVGESALRIEITAPAEGALLAASPVLVQGEVFFGPVCPVSDPDTAGDGEQHSKSKSKSKTKTKTKSKSKSKSGASSMPRETAFPGRWV